MWQGDLEMCFVCQRKMTLILHHPKFKEITGKIFVISHVAVA
jgi:hypothetical protein